MHRGYYVRLGFLLAFEGSWIGSVSVSTPIRCCSSALGAAWTCHANEGLVLVRRTQSGARVRVARARALARPRPVPACVEVEIGAIMAMEQPSAADWPWPRPLCEELRVRRTCNRGSSGARAAQAGAGKGCGQGRTAHGRLDLQI